ncbi:glycosyltransferase family 4 protein [Pseudomonas sp. Z3-6]|uniref:hypothetical protein n=1 Tax=Pseudomonas sp. Z3-6 TaxID=2817411 RepID=UPI003DA8346F
MLFVHGSLALGGVETFYVRMAQGRKKRGLVTKFLILSAESKSHPELVSRAKACAEVYFLDEIIRSPFTLPPSAIIYQFSLIYPLRRSVLQKIVNGISCAHVSNGFCAHMVLRLASILEVDLGLTMGLYHSMEFSWGARLPWLPFFEKSNREIFYYLHATQALMFFNEKMVDLYSKLSGKDFSNVGLFPLGVVDGPSKLPNKRFSPLLSLGSVGRLVDFKTYNLWMLDVVNELKGLGLAVRYDIYGYGPTEGVIAEKIKNLHLEDVVFLRGSLDYSEFANVVSKFDIFIGSGTALIEAAGLGVPSIIGIENANEATTYGFLSEIPGFSYNEDGLYIKKKAVDIFVDFSSYSEADKLNLSEAHVKKAEMFSVDTCVENFEQVKPSAMLSSPLRMKFSPLFRLLYTGDVILFSLFWRFKGRKLSQVVRSID